MNITDELQKLQQLHQSGALDDQEFAQAKARLLGQQQSASHEFGGFSDNTYAAEVFQDQQTRQWAMFLHLSLLAGFAIPVGGLVVPVLIWQLKKTELPGIDVHGRNATNWIISELIYTVVCGLLVFGIIGIPLLILLGLIALIFPVIAAIKANNGEVWKYPLSISFMT